MEIKYIPKTEITKEQQDMLNKIEEICFGFSSAALVESMEKNHEGHLFGVAELGVLALFDCKKIVGNAYLYKRKTEYDGQDCTIGGLGGLAILPAYRGQGHGRQLIEKALEMAREIGVDVACLFTERDDTVRKLYEKIGFTYINRRAYYLDSLHNEAFRNDVMIMGLNDKKLAEKILTTDHKFHYGDEEGCW